MFRILLGILIIYVIYILWKRLSSAAKRAQRRSSQGVLTGEMVSCSKCNIFILKNEAVEKKGKYYCSKQCAS